MTNQNSGAGTRARKRRIERRKRRWKILGPVPIVFAVIVLLVLGVGMTYTYLVEQPEVEAQVTAKVESRGGEVIRIAHSPRRPREPGYAVVVFDGQQSRCSLDLLKQYPPVFQCDPAVTVK